MMYYHKMEALLLILFLLEGHVGCFMMKPRLLQPNNRMGRTYHRVDKVHKNMMTSGRNGYNKVEYTNGQENGIDGAVSTVEKLNDVKVSRIGNRVLNPNHILFPSYFPYLEEDDESVNAIPLQIALIEMRRSMERILDFQTQIDCKGNIGHDLAQEIEFTLGSSLKDEANPHNRIFDIFKEESMSLSITGSEHHNPIERDQNFFTIRVEQPISHPVDPLCWLHANSKKGPSPMKDEDQGPVMLYLADAESTVEAGVYGSSHAINNLIAEHDKDNSCKNTWDIIRNLPKGCRIYGGSRFDKYLELDQRGEDWEAFGNETWVLPAIEIRQQQKLIGINTSEKDDVNGNPYFSETTLSVNLHFTSLSSLIKSVETVLILLNKVTHDISPPVPYATLPPIISRGYKNDAQEEFESAVNAALDMFDNNTDCASVHFQKVVLARRSDLNFGVAVSGLDLMMKLKFGGNIGGHLFYMNPGQSVGKEFLGCAPERLFQVRGHDRMVVSEALAGTRPRGSSSSEDLDLLNDLMYSDKDRSENSITGDFIKDAFVALKEKGFIETISNENKEPSSNVESTYFVRRLQHLQHLCQSFKGKMKHEEYSVDITQFLLNKLHPTPAVCGSPSLTALEFIRKYETPTFDRGLYAGPFGYIGRDMTDIVVAIRSGLLSRNEDGPISSKLSIFAGAGVVPGSTVQGEWSEIGYKMGVLSSFFSQSPMTLKSFATANEAWAIAFVEELIRSGVSQFYICPGSRSTPLTTALSRAMRMHIGLIDCTSVHDERAAAFRAVGYGRATGRTAAVVTSSGTAVANLYPAVVEASMDGIPLLLLTADRPYENRDIGANQSIDQLKVFSDSYIRWFRDVAPPSDEIPVSLALSDANHGATVAQDMLGPVHLNIQFRENLAPESGPIRGDNRAESMTSFSNNRFIDAPGFTRWSQSGQRWTNPYKAESLCDKMLQDLRALLAQSKRGIIVVGNLRGTDATGGTSHSRIISAIIAEFASYIGYPIFAGAQSADLRFRSSAVVPYVDHLLKHPAVKTNIKPDLVIQIGSSLISTEVQDLINKASQTDVGFNHVLLHPHKAAERHDPSGTVTHKISADPALLLPRLRAYLDQEGLSSTSTNSQLAPLVQLGREVSKHVPSIVEQASFNIRIGQRQVWEKSSAHNQTELSEPEIMLVLSDICSRSNPESQFDFFLSNSMPVRDAEFFLYPSFDCFGSGKNNHNYGLGSVAVNRGASGIDGIISSATGYVEATSTPATLLIGDLATLHDLNAFHHVSNKKGTLPLTTIIINNDGGGIFSFLPIAKFGNEVGFEDFFGTPTNSFSFSKGAEAFGLPLRQASSLEEFRDAYRSSLDSNKATVIEAKVVGREENVQIHREISRLISTRIDNILGEDGNPRSWNNDSFLPARFYSYNEDNPKNTNVENYIEGTTKAKTLVLLHGWMGDKNEWNEVANSLVYNLPKEWKIISLDLPGHGDTKLLNPPTSMLRKMLNLETANDGASQVSIENIATAILKSLPRDHGVERIDAIAGYSLGGRVALSMRKMACSDAITGNKLISDDTHLILLGSSPGEFHVDLDPSQVSADRLARKIRDDLLAKEMYDILVRSFLSSHCKVTMKKIWTSFLQTWYGNSSLWSNLHKRQPSLYQEMIQLRIHSLSTRPSDLAEVLQMSSPGRNSADDWKFISPEFTLFMAGELDTKYSQIGEKWASLEASLNYQEIENAGHALLIEAPDQVAENIYKALTNSTEASNSRSDKTLTIQSIDRLLEKDTMTQVRPAALDMEHFVIAMSGSKSTGALRGIGWGENAKSKDRISEREGYIISISSDDGRFVGIGEVSPLNGVHRETIDDVKEQLNMIRDALSTSDIPAMECERILALDGAMDTYINSFIQSISLSPSQLHASIKAGLEMSFMSISSEATKLPLPQALMVNSLSSSQENFLRINGLVTRGEKSMTNEQQNFNTPIISYPSIKIKVGHRDPVVDAQQVISTQKSNANIRVRADANRSWNESSGVAFGSQFSAFGAIERLEFVEEPLQKQASPKQIWDLSTQVAALEKWHKETGIQYALDESIADVVQMSKGESFEAISEKIRMSLRNASGCAAIVLKPTLLGMELSFRLGRMAHEDLDIAAVFTSTFESGIGLAFTSFIAFASDSFIKKDERQTKQYPHGISTFSLLNGDTLSPSFETFVNEEGKINISSLGRVIYGLSLDEIRDSSFTMEEIEFDRTSPQFEPNSYQVTSFTSESGREISIQVSLPLPFSDDIACTRFADLPQQPRWSPWLKSVSYVGNGETEWTLNVRGVEFRWKAMSKFLESSKGMVWESISGLKNKGRVEFTSVSENSCVMTVKMSIITPRIISLVFKTSGEFVKEFIERKLLKWSLESFRDVVKADLALERGEAELGDALIGAVEGRSNAIEATLSRINDLT